MPRANSKKKEELPSAAAEASTTAAAASSAPAAAAKKASATEEEAEDVFEENEIVLAKDNSQLYEAKVLKVQAGKKGTPPQYFIHYQGWKSKWDKWVGSDALLKRNDDTLKIQAQLRQAAKKRPGGASAGGGGGGEEGGKSEESSSSSNQKRGKAEASSAPVDPDVEPVVERVNDPQVKIAMPFTLKRQLVDDWEMVTREPHQLIPLPRTPSAAAVLASFLAHKKEKGSTSALQLRRFEELLDGLRVYFDKALPLILLYRHERAQYEQFFSSSSSSTSSSSASSSSSAGASAAGAASGDGGGATSSSESLPPSVSNNSTSSSTSSSNSSNSSSSTSSSSKRPSDVYGAEHLLRLFVRLPHLLAQAPMPPAELTQVQAKLGEILKFLQKQHGEMFLTSYRRKEEEEGKEGGKEGGVVAMEE